MEARWLPAAAAVLALVGCMSSSTAKEEGPGAAPLDALPRGGAVLYTIGLSTDPYGESRPNGFGVATRIVAGRLRKVELRDRGLGWFGGAEWLPGGEILVHREAPPLRRPLVFLFGGERLQRGRLAPFVSGSAYRWSPDGTLLAVEPPAPCHRGQRSLFECYRGSGRIVVLAGDAFRRRLATTGTAPGWTADGRLVFYRTQRDWTQGRAVILDVASGRRISRERYWVNEEPLASADGRYLVDYSHANRRTTLVIRRAEGRIVTRISTPYLVSMVAWSPHGHRLAYTTSGWPDPHELFLLDPARDKPRRVFASGAPHFDWITWSPDGRWLLLDDEAAGRWRVFSASTGEQVRVLPRLGGRPLWCCPLNAYASLGGRSP